MSNIKDNGTLHNYFTKSKNSEHIEYIHTLWKEHLQVFPNKSYYAQDYSFLDGFMNFVAEKMLSYDKNKEKLNNKEKISLLTDIALDLYNMFYKKRSIKYGRYTDLLIAFEATNQYDLIKKHKINIHDKDYIYSKFISSLKGSIITKNNTNDIFQSDNLPLTYEKLTSIRNKYNFKSDIWLSLLHNPCMFRAYIQDGNKVSNEQIKKAFRTCFCADHLSREELLMQHSGGLEDFVHGFSQTNQFKNNILPQKNYIAALNKFFADEISVLDLRHKSQSGTLVFWQDAKNDFFYHPVFKFNKLDGKMKEKLYLENFGTKFVNKEQEKIVDQKIEEIPIKKKIKI